MTKIYYDFVIDKRTGSALTPRSLERLLNNHLISVDCTSKSADSFLLALCSTEPLFLNIIMICVLL
jgi:hypothetical protein